MALMAGALPQVRYVRRRKWRRSWKRQQRDGQHDNCSHPHFLLADWNILFANVSLVSPGQWFVGWRPLLGYRIFNWGPRRQRQTDWLARLGSTCPLWVI